MVFPATNPPVLVRDRLLVHPMAAQRVLELLNRPGTTHAELCSLVEIDPALAAAVLRTANSTHLGYSGRIAGIRHATVLLGGSLVASLAASRVADLVFDVAQPDYPEWLWQHSLVVASGAAVLATYMGENADDAYTTGLLHDVGSLLAATNVTDAASGDAGTTGDLGVAQVAAGADLLRRWNLPDRVVAGVRFHRASANGLVGLLERLVATASAFAAELGAPGPERTMSPSEAMRMLQSASRPDDVMSAIDDEVTRRTTLLRTG